MSGKEHNVQPSKVYYDLFMIQQRISRYAYPTTQSIVFSCTYLMIKRLHNVDVIYPNNVFILPLCTENVNRNRK